MNKMIAITISLISFVSLVASAQTMYSSTGHIGLGSSSLSGTSSTRRELNNNAQQVAQLAQAYSPQMANAIKTARIEMAGRLGADAVSLMTDMEVIAASLQEK